MDDTYDPPLKAITEAIDLIGDCTIPTALLVLGASLSQQLSSHYAVVSRPMVLLNTLLKLVIMPICTLLFYSSYPSTINVMNVM